MTDAMKKNSILADFVGRNRHRLIATAVGGIALACAAQPMLADNGIREQSTQGREWAITEKLAAIVKERPPEQIFLGSAASIINPGDLDEIRESIDDKRARLEGAMRELENLEIMVEVAQALDPSERDDAVATAILLYNDAVAGAEYEVDVDLDSERLKGTFEKAESSTNLLLTLRPMQGQ